MRCRFASLALIPLFFGCAAAPETAPVGTARQASTTVCPPVTVEGLDVSSGNGTIDWSAVASSGRKFAFIKATQGDYYTNDHFVDQWPGAAAAGLLRSPYHFFDPTIDGVAQAQHFLSVVGTLADGDLPPMLDIECPTSSDQSQTQPNCEYGGSNPDSGWVDAATMNQRIAAWLDYVAAHTGRTPIVYSYNYWFQDSGADTAPLHSYPLFISWPTASNCYEVGLGNDFTSATFWQWSVTGSCPGVNGEVDLDRFDGSVADLQALAVQPGVGGGGGAGGSGVGPGGGAATVSSSATGGGGGGGAGGAPIGSGGSGGAGAGGDSDSGCGCRVGANDSGGAVALASLLIALALAARRRISASLT
jgi:lysozyme